eukprot:CAMPEP_0168565058 /NCGR_PEP_ID=MMETSP0413-20121227/13601_1 /TAXON_ID=136452 /ORGANISM="Filamoeba nolandi, Strain NC-AS-23-1" /LENGTH=717 /DNA_ID=CAMNT_0008596821 /DNA_START=116 /DNA_END=2266 /DNA_ORIENTATION=+
MDSSMQSSTIITIKIDGIILSVDKNCCKLFGYTLDELIGQPVKKLIPPPYKEQHDQFLSNYATTRIPKIIGKSRVVEGQHKDGTIFPIRLSVSKVGGSGKVSAVSCGEGTTETCPVTGMKGSNPHLSENNNNNSLLSASHNPLECDDETIFIGMIDKLEDKSGSITINTNGIIVSCNQNVEELFGYRANELIGSNVHLIMPSPHKERHDTYISNYLKGGIPKVIGKVRNVPARHKQGNVFPISLQVEPIKVGPITLFRGKIEKVNEMEAVFLIDGDGLIKSCNQNFVVSLFGYSANELIGENISVLIPKIHQRTTEPTFPPHNEETMVPEAKRVKLSQASNDSWKSPGIHRKELQHRDGSLFPVILEISTYQDDQGKMMYAARIRRADSETKQLPENQLKSIGDYYITKTVGQGSYGKVKLAYHRDSKEYVAIKILQKAKMLPPELERARRETEILSKLNHPNIVRLLKVVETDTSMNIIMEYAGRTLLSYVLERGGLGEFESRKFFLQLLSAVEYCHNRNIVHRDIKHQNILLDDQLNCKVIDFGLSNFMEEGKMRSTFCGTPAYASPEMIVGKKYVGPEVDIWSMGVVLYSMITGVFPFENVGDIIKGHLKEPSGVSRECLDLIKRMLTVDITQRACLQDILKHPWVLGTQLPNDSNASSPPMDHAGVANTSSLPNSPTQSSPSVSSGSSLENNCVPVKVIECTVVSTNVPEEKS